MHKQTIILIVVLALVTGILIFLAISNQNLLKTNLSNTNIPTGIVVQKTAKVFFSPENIDLSSAVASPTSSVDIMVDSGGQPIAGVQAEMQYDPKAISNVKIIPAADPTGFFGSNATILFNDVNAQTGRVSYVIAISPSENGKNGIGKIGTITFTKTPGALTPSTAINFLDKTLVTRLNVNDSVLKEATPLNITLSKTTTIPNRPIQTAPLISPATSVPVSPSK